jgi:hypothetical protein
MWQDLYLVRLWKQSKGIFLFVLAFTALQLFLNLKRIHTFPFIVWDMYSQHQEVPDVSSLYVFYLDGKIYDHTRLPIWKEETAMKSFRMYHWQKMNYGHDPMDAVVKHRTRFFPELVYQYAGRRINNHPEAYENYPDWLFYYMRKATQSYFKKLEIKELKYFYKNGAYVPNGEIYTYLVVQHD